MLTEVRCPVEKVKVQTAPEASVCTCHCNIFSDYSNQSLAKPIHRKEDLRSVSHWNVTYLNRIAREPLSMDTIRDNFCDMV